MIKRQLNNSVRLSKSAKTIEKFSQFVTQHPFMWELKNFMRVTLKHLIKILLKSEIKFKVFTIKLKVYLSGNNIYYLINKTLDKIHHSGQPRFKIWDTLFGFYVFIIWIIDAKNNKKGYTVMDIKIFKKIIFLDS